MKKTKAIACVLLTLFFVTDGFALSSRKKQKEILALESVIEQINNEYKDLVLQKSHLSFEKYIAYCEVKKMSLPVFSMPDWLAGDAMKEDAHLATLRMEFEYADDVLRQILNKNQEYRDMMIRMYRTISNEERTELERLRSNIFARLKSTDKEYGEARKLRDEALQRSNFAIAEYALKTCRENGIPVPIIIPDQVGLENDVEIKTVTYKLNVLDNLLRRKVFELEELKYNTDK